MWLAFEKRVSVLDCGEDDENVEIGPSLEYMFCFASSRMLMLGIVKASIPGGVGAVEEVLIEAVRGQPALRLGLTVGTNFLVVASCFGGAQEISRELQASKPEHWVDCAVGGLASGALLGHFQGGQSRALPMGILFASVGTGLQLGAIQYREYRIRHFLSTLPSESLIAESHAQVPAVVEQESSEDNSWRTPDWFPIQMLIAEEAEACCRT